MKRKSTAGILHASASARTGLNLNCAIETAKYTKYAEGQWLRSRSPLTGWLKSLGVKPHAARLFSRGSRISRFTPTPVSGLNCLPPGRPAVRSWIRSLTLLPLLAACLLLNSGCSLFHASTTREYRAAVAAGPYDALIVPGFPSKDGRWNRVIKARVCWAAELHRQGIGRNLIFSGAAVHSPYVEGELMALYALAIGIPEPAIHTETSAHHSSENLYYSYQLARRLGFEKIAVVSDPIHTVHLRKMAREFELPLAFLPVDFIGLSQLPKTDPAVDASRAYVEEFVPLNQRATREEIRIASAGGRIRAELAGPALAEAGAGSLASELNPR